MAMDVDFARWFTSKVSFENEIPYYRSRNPPPQKNWEFWWVPRRMTMSQEVSARILSLETPRFPVANEGLDWDSRTLKMFHNSGADERLHPRWWEHSNSHWLHEDHITGPSKFSRFLTGQFFWALGSGAVNVVMLNAAISACERGSETCWCLWVGGWWLRSQVSFLQVSCSFFEREGFPPFFCDLKGSIGWVDQIKKRVEQVSNTFTHPIFVLRCPVVKGANNLTKAKLVPGHLANGHLTFVTALFALTNAHVEDIRWAETCNPSARFADDGLRLKGDSLRMQNIPKNYNKDLPEISLTEMLTKCSVRYYSLSLGHDVLSGMESSSSIDGPATLATSWSRCDHLQCALDGEKNWGSDPVTPKTGDFFCWLSEIGFSVSYTA